MRVNPIQSNVKAVYKTHIDVIHFRKTDEKRLHGLDDEAEQKLFTEDRVQALKELSAKPDVYERLASALAPSIYEHEDIKKVCECTVNALVLFIVSHISRVGTLKDGDGHIFPFSTKQMSDKSDILNDKMCIFY